MSETDKRHKKIREIRTYLKNAPAETPRGNALLEWAMYELIAVGINAAESKPLLADPPPALLESLACRYRHDFILLGEKEREPVLTVMRQLYEEIAGQGFYHDGWAFPESKPDNLEWSALQNTSKPNQVSISKENFDSIVSEWVSQTLGVGAAEPEEIAILRAALNNQEGNDYIGDGHNG